MRANSATAFKDFPVHRTLRSIAVPFLGINLKGDFNVESCAYSATRHSSGNIADFISLQHLLYSQEAHTDPSIWGRFCDVRMGV